ncbi:Alpha/Beta hydrolase protein [Cyathus striatus]|nr:Alpha/Beta hydrolase protein [Cyathus striatus]
MTITKVLCLISLLGVATAKTIRPEILQPSGRTTSLDQLPLSSYDDGLFTPLENPSTLSDVQFSVLQHPAFPKYQVRMKKTRFCDETVNTYTGYIDIEARHLFFWFFETKSGCSPSAGLFMELGPCRILSEDGPKFFPESWNSNANLLAVEQPIGVGFSYADYGETVVSARNIAAFLAIFFQHFTKFKGRPLHMAGESHGVSFCRERSSDQTRMTPVNLTSVIIATRKWVTDATIQIPYYYDMACTRAGGLSPVADIKTCIRMKQAVPRCKKWLKESSAIMFCESELEEPISATGIFPYKPIQPVETCGEWDEIPCYPAANYITKHLNLPSTRALLGIDPNFTKNMTLAPHVGALLERGIKALIYVGKNDFSCNWLGNEAWINALDWSGQKDMLAAEKKPWIVDGQKAGKVRSAKGLSFVTVDGAGHMVPYDKPREALQLINDWLRNKLD